ncbi:MAG: SLC13 family permease [Gemmatimonadota bacterium]
MSLPLISLLALLAAILISSFTRVNVGVLAIAFAFIIGTGLGDLGVRDVVRGFPSNLFLTLVGITLLFSMARQNGTLDRITSAALGLARGRAGLVPVVFFLLALVFATAGPGNIAATAMLAPVAMAAAGRAGIPPLLMAVLVCNGANAGGLSPIAPTGIIANDLMAQIGLVGFEWRNYLNALVAQTFVAVIGFLVLGGPKLLAAGGKRVDGAMMGLERQEWQWQQKWTLIVIGLLLVAIVLLDLDVVMGAFLAAGLLSVSGATDEQEALAKVPWAAILLVCGVTVLVAIVGSSGGIDLAARWMAGASNPVSVNGLIAFVTGVLSVYASTSGVILPAFIPMVPGLVENLGGGDMLAITSSINVGGHLVDVSPLSTLGAICLAAAPDEVRSKLFNQLLVWGLSMSLVGAVVCWVFFGILG